MTRKDIKKLAAISFTKNMLDQNKVMKIVSHLSIKELKFYIKELKKRENEHTVVVSLPTKPSQEERKLFQKKFENKKIEFHEDPSLILGARIVDNDLVYDVNLKTSLETLSDEIGSYE